MIGLGSSLYTANEGTQLPIKVFKQGIGAVTVNVSTTDSTAAFMKDYSLQTYTVTFLPNEIVRTIIINILADNNYEGSENFIVTLNSNQSNITFSQTQATIFIHDLTGSFYSMNMYYLLIFINLWLIVAHVTFDPRNYVIMENGGPVNLMLERNFVNLSIPINLQLRVISQTAKGNPGFTF